MLQMLQIMKRWRDPNLWVICNKIKIRLIISELYGTGPKS